MLPLVFVPSALWEAIGTITLDGTAYLTVTPAAAYTMEARGTLTLEGRARLSFVGAPTLPPTDDIGWITPEEAVSPLAENLVVTVGGLTIVRAQIADLTIDLDIEGGPKAASLTVNCALDRAPRLYRDTLVVTYKGQTLFRGRLESIASEVSSSTGYTLTYGGPMVSLRDHKAFRRIYVDSDLQNWQTDQGPRSAPDAFEVASMGGG